MIKKYLKLFLSETSEPFDNKYGWNGAQMILGQSILSVDKKSKLNATVSQSLNIIHCWNFFFFFSKTES